MNLEGARIVLRTRTPSEIFDLAIRFCASLALPLYLRLAAIVLVPCMLATGGFHLYVGEGDWTATWAFAAALAALAQGVFTVAASRLLFDSRPRVGPILWHTLKRSPALLGALLMHGVMLALGLFIVVGSFLVWIWHTFLYEAVLLEQQGPGAAIARAGALLKRRFGAGLMVCSGSAAIVGLFVACSEALGQGLFDFVLQLGKPFGEFDLDEGNGTPFMVIGFFASLPLVATARFLSYIDGRTRQDGWDIQLRFMSVAAGHDARPGGDE